jgi:hypothetical protein
VQFSAIVHASRYISDASRIASSFGVSAAADTPPTLVPAGMNVRPANAKWAMPRWRRGTTS